MRNQAGVRHGKGMTLVATLLLVAAATLSAAAALRSTVSELQLTGTLLAANNAFALAELGLAAGMQKVLADPASLPDAGSLSLPPQEVAGTGSINTVIQAGAHDDHCPALAPLPGIRQHFEIRATGFADRSVSATHVQGFYVCREVCVTTECVALELLPVKAYWFALAGTDQ